VAGPFVAEDRGCGIYVPGVSSHGHEEATDSDEAMERWMDGLELALNAAFQEKLCGEWEAKDEPV
jgi:hypothetical protein